MKKFLGILTALLLLSSTSNTHSSKKVISILELEPKPIKEIVVEVPEVKPIDLVEALIIVESQGNDSAIGDTHLGAPSVGVLQIRPIMVREVNRILKLKKTKLRFKLRDRFDRDKSIQMFTIWKEFHHKDSDFETIARNWNGGPNGYKRSSTLHYWKKVEMELIN